MIDTLNSPSIDHSVNQGDDARPGASNSVTDVSDPDPNSVPANEI